MPERFKFSIYYASLLLVALTLVAAIFSGWRYLELKRESGFLIELPRDGATWGALQLQVEGLKFQNALQAIRVDNSAENQAELALRLDLLFSRIDVIEQVLSRASVNQEAYRDSEVFQAIESDRALFLKEVAYIESLFEKIDQETQQLLKNSDLALVSSILPQAEELNRRAAFLSSRINQSMLETVISARQTVFGHMGNFQAALLIIISSLLAFSVLSFVLYRKTHRAEMLASKTAGELRIASQAKTDFLSSMSHELRTPLNAILGFGQVLESDSDQPLTEDQRQSVNHIMSGGYHLLELIDQVLELNKIESGKFELNLQSVDTGDLIEESMFWIQSRAEAAEVSVKKGKLPKKLPVLRTDPTRLRQILLNLLSNAVKYNRPQGSVVLSCEVRPESWFRITVADTGQGIPTDKQDRLFQPFERLGRESGTIEGTGIGLSITKQITELLGGRIGFSSTFGKGSEFWIELPVTEAQLSDAAAPEHDRQETDEPSARDDQLDLPLRKVLYIEDSPSNRLLMQAIMKGVDNTQLVLAEDAESGLELVKELSPDLILLDINLPGLNGYDALAKLKENQIYRDIPVIAVSANASAADINKALDAGFSDYITKPLNVPELIVKLEKNLSFDIDALAV